MEELKGLMTALITPFDQNGDLDEEGLKTLIAEQMEAKVDSLLLLGSTGEMMTLSPEERERVVELTIKASSKPVIVNVGTNNTSESIARAQRAEQMGADALLVVTPYYLKPPQEGIFRHFEEIAKKVSLPIIIYNIPGRTGRNIEVATLKKLAKIPNVIALKESSGDFAQAFAVMKDLIVLSGDDGDALPLIALGAQGHVSVTSNLLPKEMKKLVDASIKGNFEEARKMQAQLFPLFQVMFSESNPIPLKKAMQLLKLPSGEPRLPLTPMENVERMQTVLEEMGYL